MYYIQFVLQLLIFDIKDQKRKKKFGDNFGTFWTDKKKKNIFYMFLFAHVDFFSYLCSRFCLHACTCDMYASNKL